MNKYVFIPIMLLTFMTTSFARIAQSQTAVIIKEFDGKLYQMQYQQWQDIKPETDLSDYEIKPPQWLQQIKNAQPQPAITLLRALAHHLPNDELKPYLLAGLERKSTQFGKNLQVAQATYRIWKTVYGWQSAYQVRKDQHLRKNLSPDVLWKNLYLYPEDGFADTFAAIEFLRKDESLKTLDTNEYLVNAAISKIAAHNNMDDLMLWMEDEEFSIALGSWLALHRINPKLVANQILEKATWWQAELEYTYGSGCVIQVGQLSPLQAALDLFSDYLSTETIHKTFLDAPEIWQNGLIEQFRITNPQSYQAMQKFDTKDLIGFKRFHNQMKLQKMSLNELSEFMDNTDNVYEVDQIIFTQNLLTYLLKKIEENKEIKHHLFTYDAFLSKNKLAKQYISALIKQIDDSNSAENMHDLLEEHLIWPRDWQDLKQNLIQKLKPYKNDIKYPNLSLLRNETI